MSTIEPGGSEGSSTPSLTLGKGLVCCPGRSGGPALIFLARLELGQMVWDRGMYRSEPSPRVNPLG